MAKSKKQIFAELEQMSVDGLKELRDELKTLLSTLEDDYRKAKISEKSYKEVKRKNKMKLDKVVDILYNMGISEESEPPSEETKPATETTTPATESSATVPPNAPESAPTTKSSSPTPPPVNPVAPVSSGVSETKFKAEMEKLNLLLDTVKQSGSSVDEKIMRLTENLGELRSLVYQREGIAKDQDLKIQKLDEQMSEIKPEKIGKDFAKRDKGLSEHDMKIEKLEFKAADLIKSLGDIRALLKSIGGLENIAEVNKEISKKVTSIDNKSKKIDRMSNKIEEIFVDLNKKMEDFFLYKAKQETIDELVQELMRSTDSLSVKMKEYVSKNDLDSLKEDMASVGNRLGDMKKLIDMIIPIMKLKIPEKLQSLQKEKEDIENLIATMEDSYRKGKITQKEFKEAKKKNQEKLDKVIKDLGEEWKRFEAGQDKSLPTEDVAKPVETKSETVEDKTEEKTEENENKPKTDISDQKDESMEDKKVEDKTEEKTEENESKNVKKTEEDVQEEDNDEAEEKVELENDEKKSENESIETVEENKENQDDKKIDHEKDNEKVDDTMMSDLEDAFKKGLISKEAFEKTKKMLKGE